MSDDATPYADPKQERLERVAAPGQRPATANGAN